MSSRITNAIGDWWADQKTTAWDLAEIANGEIEIRFREPHRMHSKVVAPISALVWALALDAGSVDVALTQCSLCRGRGLPVYRICANRQDAESTAEYRRAHGYNAAVRIAEGGQFEVVDDRVACRSCNWQPLPVLVFAGLGLGKSVARLPVIADQLQAQGHPLGTDIALWLADEFTEKRLVWPESGLPRCAS